MVQMGIHARTMSSGVRTCVAWRLFGGTVPDSKRHEMNGSPKGGVD